MSERVTVEKLPDGRLVAVKVARTHADTERLLHEREVLDRARHPGVVELVALERPDSGPARLVTVLAGDHTLSAASRPPLPRAAALVASVASTLADLHSVGVVHGRVDASHLVLASGGRPILCGFADASLDPGEGDPQPHDDVAAVGRLVRHLLDPETDAEPIPDRRGIWQLRGRPKWTGYQQRALLTLADQATAHDPRHRPSARALAAAVAEAFPEASLRAPAPQPSPNRTVHRASQPVPQPRRAEHTPRRPWRPTAGALAAAAAGILGLTSLVAGVGVLRAGERPEVRAATADGRPPDPPPSSPTTRSSAPVTSSTSTAAERPTSGDGNGFSSGTGRPPCPAPAGPVADLDGDGCAGPLAVQRGVVVTDAGRFAVGEADDHVLLGDWDCDGSSTPAVLRSGTGDVFVFERWASSERDETVEPTTRVADSTGARVDTRAGCDHLVIETRQGDQAVDLSQAAP